MVLVNEVIGSKVANSGGNEAIQCGVANVNLQTQFSDYRVKKYFYHHYDTSSDLHLGTIIGKHDAMSYE